MTPNRFKLIHFGLHVHESLFHQDLGVTAGARPSVPHVQNLFDVAQAQTHPLETFDEAESVG